MREVLLYGRRIVDMGSRFFSERHKTLVAYTPGEQPQGGSFIKLNTNELPYAPTEAMLSRAAELTRSLNLYPDPDCRVLRRELADRYGVADEEILVTNGSDEILSFAFLAFCDRNHPAVFPDITYGFYKVWADLYGIPYRTIPLRDDFSVEPRDYLSDDSVVFLANPNAPTGRVLPLRDIEMIVAGDSERVVVIDEAYIDFGGQSAVQLIHQYQNLLVTQTFSKSRGLAGARLGYGIACRSLIEDLNTIRNAINPYNINSASMAIGLSALENDDFYKDRCRRIVSNRERLTLRLREKGFEVLDSSANFVFAKHPAISGEELYDTLRSEGVLVRHFTGKRITDYNRITVGTEEQVDALNEAIGRILEVRT